MTHFMSVQSDQVKVAEAENSVRVQILAICRTLAENRVKGFHIFQYVWQNTLTISHEQNIFQVYINLRLANLMPI